jgi:hypothetical protein
VAAQHQVVEHGRAFEQLDVLEGPRDAMAHHVVAGHAGELPASSRTEPALASNTA